jgi:HD superfamily phosphohydrolase
MYYKDTIYGSYKIQEPVILELINSPAMQRLKGIDQA